MSELQKIWDSIPLSERFCQLCGNELQRNWALFNGKLYHWGCLKKTKAKPTHRCLDCFGFLTAIGMITVDYGDTQMRACGYCGSTHLRKVDAWYKDKYLK